MFPGTGPFDAELPNHCGEKAGAVATGKGLRKGFDSLTSDSCVLSDVRNCAPRMFTVWQHFRPESKLLVDAMAGYGALGAPAALAAGSAYKLSSGYEMPMLGYGTFRSEPGVVKGAVLEAIKAGYRHLDLAHVYGNEKEVGQALKEAFESKIVTRGDLFLVGKLWNSDHDVDIVPQAYQKSCDDLGVEYLDLYLIHFPVAVNHTGLDNPNFGPGGG